MKILEKIKIVFNRLTEIIDRLYECLPLDKANDFLSRKSIKINVKSEKSKIIFRVFFAVVCLAVLSEIFSGTGDRDYQIDDRCLCLPPDPPTEIPNPDFVEFDNCAGYGDFKHVKYFVKNHYEKLTYRDFKEAIDWALKSRHVDIAEYLIKHEPDQAKPMSERHAEVLEDSTRQMWVERLNNALGEFGSCKVLKLVLKHGKAYLKQPLILYKHEFDPILEAVGSTCKLKICLDYGFRISGKSAYLARAIGVCTKTLGTVWDKSQVENQELKWKQEAAEKILMANFEILLKHGARDFDQAIDALCQQPVLRLKYRVKILELFE